MHLQHLSILLSLLPLPRFFLFWGKRSSPALLSIPPFIPNKMHGLARKGPLILPKKRETWKKVAWRRNKKKSYRNHPNFQKWDMGPTRKMLWLLMAKLKNIVRMRHKAALMMKSPQRISSVSPTNKKAMFPWPQKNKRPDSKSKPSKWRCPQLTYYRLLMCLASLLAKMSFKGRRRV